MRGWLNPLKASSEKISKSKDDKAQRKLIDDIKETEKSIQQIFNRRLALIEEIRELDSKEEQLKEHLLKKKEDLRTLSNTQSNNRNRRLTRTVSVTFKQDTNNTHNTNLRVTSEGIANPKKSIKLLDTIEVQLEKSESSSDYFESLYQSKASEKFLKLIPNLKLKSGGSMGESLVRIIGPADSKTSPTEDPPIDLWKGIICAQAISTYPISATKDRKDGDPICDRYYAEIYSNCSIIAMADGCNWGTRPRSAALKSTEAFVHYMSNLKMLDFKRFGNNLFNAVSYAHNNIVLGCDDVWEAGTTTLIGGVLAEIECDDPTSFGQDLTGPLWAFVCVSVGDCKAFRWSSKTRKVIDITEGNRQNITDASDPGGRIGPYLSGGAPDLRNLDLYFEICEEGDLILLFSDGVHDNMDPQFLGHCPSDFQIEAENWKDADKSFPDDTEEAKNLFRNKLLEDIIDKVEQETKKLEILDIHRTIMDHCITITKNGREFLETHPNKRIPDDPVAYPGKMDHTSACIIRVGKCQ